MTIQEAIARVDSLKPNQYKHPEKVAWLSDVDGKIYTEVISKRENTEGIEWKPYTENTDVSLKLLVDDPYTEVYIYYLCAKIDWYNGEYDRYNNDMTAFNQAYQESVTNYVKGHKSLGLKYLRL